MNVHYGGALKQVDGHIAQRHLTALDPAFFLDCPDSISVNSFHNFAIEAAAHEALPQFGVMWHPEREGAPAKHDLLLIHAAFGDVQP